MIGLGTKTDTKGFMALFEGCMNQNDPKVWKIMKRYNLQDIVLTEKLYQALLPWIKTHPIDLDNPEGCKNCGSHKVQKRGFRDTNTYRYQRYQCGDCGSWMRGRTRIDIPKPDFI